MAWEMVEKLGKYQGSRGLQTGPEDGACNKARGARVCVCPVCSALEVPLQQLTCPSLRPHPRVGDQRTPLIKAQDQGSVAGLDSPAACQTMCSTPDSFHPLAQVPPPFRG